MSDSYFHVYLAALDAAASLDRVLGDETPIHPPAEDYGYSSTPRNALTFAKMGVDGVHYSVLAINGRVSNESPVIQVSPGDFGDYHRVLAGSFLEFLAVGCGADVREMKEVLADERDGGATLVPFLSKHFRIQRLWNYSRSNHLRRFLKYIEPKIDGT